MNVTIAGHAIETLGFVGLGVMGEPMCANLVVKCGLPVVGADPRDAPLQSLAELGMQVARGGAAEVGGRVDLAFVCVANGEQLQQACFGEEGLLASGTRVKVVVDCSTTSVSLTRECARHAAELGVTWVDAPVARMREAARNGALLFMVGATEEVYASLVPLLSCMGSDIDHCGATGSGQVVKILNNKVLIEAVHSLAEALALGRAAGVDGRVLFNAFEKGSANSNALRVQGIRHLLPGDFPPRTFPTLYARKDIGLALSLADDVGIDARCARNTAGLLDRTIEAGYADEYYPVLLRLIKTGEHDQSRHAAARR